MGEIQGNSDEGLLRPLDGAMASGREKPIRNKIELAFPLLEATFSVQGVRPNHYCFLGKLLPLEDCCCLGLESLWKLEEACGRETTLDILEPLV